eukprot:COSAG06_NODE_5439_length_3481_cov_6.214666_5_plen_98_part_00
MLVLVVVVLLLLLVLVLVVVVVVVLLLLLVVVVVVVLLLLVAAIEWSCSSKRDVQSLAWASRFAWNKAPASCSSAVAVRAGSWQRTAGLHCSGLTQS